MASWTGLNPSMRVLPAGEVVSLRPRGRACRVSCVAGRLWVTAGGCPADSVLTAGEEILLRGHGTVVIEALRTATVRVDFHAPAGVKRSVLEPQVAF